MNVNPEPMRVLLGRALSVVDRMQRLLADEYQALSKADSEGLVRIAAAKQKAMAELDEAHGQIDNLLAHWALPGGAEGMKHVLEQCRMHAAPEVVAEGRDLPSLWKRLAKSLAEVRRLNGINGSIIAESDRRLRDLLGTVRGQREMSLYGQDGRSSFHGGGRDLATL
ncbi:MAG: flagella synthesis protein FlgN [Gammaproteobacteria bacterium]